MAKPNTPPEKRRGDYKQYKKQPFIDAFKEVGTITHAAQAVHIAVETVHDWRKTDPAFEKAFLAADESITDLLRRSALNKAIKGMSRPIFQGGVKVGEYREYSDRLHALLLQARDPMFRPHIRHEFDEGFIRYMMTQLRAVVQRNVVDLCPHCGTHMNITTKVRQDLEELSMRFRKMATDGNQA